MTSTAQKAKNLAGRPRGSYGDQTWRTAINKAVREWREADVEGKPQKIRALNLLARKLVEKGIEGDVTALKEIGDRLDGKPTQAVEVDLAVAVTQIEWLIVDPEGAQDADQAQLPAPEGSEAPVLVDLDAHRSDDSKS